MQSRTNWLLVVTAFAGSAVLPGCYETVKTPYGYHDRFVGATPNHVVGAIQMADHPIYNHGPDYSRTAPGGTVTTHTPYYPPKPAAMKKPVAKPAVAKTPVPPPTVVVVKKKPGGC